MSLRILHAIDSAGLYGAEVVLLNLMVCQREMGLSPVLLSLGNTSSGPKEIEGEANKNGLEVLTCRFRNGFNLKGALKILDCARNSRAEIIHSHGYKGNILLGALPRRTRKIPVVATLHGWTAKSSLSKLWVYEWVDALAIKRLDKAVVVSSTMLKHPHLKWFGIKPVVINNGTPELKFDSEAFAQECPEVARNCKDKFKIISIGRLSPEKGGDVLIRALAKIVLNGIDASLVFVGEGPEREELIRLATDQNISDRVHFVGYRDRAYRYLPSFDLFVLPSHTEGLPITLLEAMQAQIPIVATSVGEIPEVLDHGRYGHLIDPGNPVNLAGAIEEVYRDRETAKTKAISARDRALETYGLEGMVEKYYELYQEVMKSDK